MADDRVGDELLVGRILLGRGAGEKEIVGRIEKGRHVARGFEAEPFKSSQAVENRAGDDKDVLFGGHDRGD